MHQLPFSARPVEKIIPALEGHRALVVDDDFNTCSSVTRMLADIDVRPDWTTSGREAILRGQLAREQNADYDVYIVDWPMPDMNGVEVVRRIRAMVGENTPIIILTAYDWADIEDEAREAGVTAFCPKPVFLSELRGILGAPFAEKGSEKEEEPQSFEGTKILLVEDNEMNLEVAVEMLSEFGFKIDVAGDGVLAVERMREAMPGQYDLNLMDIQMPVMNGYEATKKIRALENRDLANIPIVAMTADAFEEDKKAATEAGMNAHIAKPIDLPVRMRLLGNILKPAQSAQ